MIINPRGDIKIISVYESIHKKNKKNLFGSTDTFTFYSDHSFLFESHGPAMKISMTSEQVLGIGFWEIIGKELILITPITWLSSMQESSHPDAEIYPFHEEIFILKGRKLFQKEKYHSADYFKWVKASTARKLKRQ